MNPQLNTPIHGQLFGDFVIGQITEVKTYKNVKIVKSSENIGKVKAI